VGHTAGLDDVEKRKFLTLPGLELRPLGRPARSQSLYRLRYVKTLRVYFSRVRTFALLNTSFRCGRTGFPNAVSKFFEGRNPIYFGQFPEQSDSERDADGGSLSLLRHPTDAIGKPRKFTHKNYILFQETDRTILGRT
jgi:hypothetical protein